MTPRMTDALTYALAASLAAGCLVFAGYKVVSLGAIENPPADMGLNFPPGKRKVITDDAVRVDSMTTQSTAPATDSQTPSGRLVQPWAADAPVQNTLLLTVIDGVAFVEVETFKGKDIRPIGVGTRLPGAGIVDRIEKINGHWTLIAGEVKLVAER
jgi:hypothetical protein